MKLKLIPNICISKSEGEKKLFYKLQSGDCLNGSVALHSLNLASHVSNAEGEADFVLLIPGKGILVIEVKDHERVKFEDGKWILGNDKPKVGGPVKQAREAMYSLLEYIRTNLPAASRVPITFLVWFTNTEFDADKNRSIEWETWQFLNIRDLDEVQTSINRVIEQSIEHLKSKPATRHVLPESLTMELVDKIVELLRPRFETVLQESTLRKMRRDEMGRLIEDQYRVIDGMEENSRVLVSGPAGTGKTLLALEKTRRLQLQGKRVLYLCFNTFLQNELASRNLDIEVLNISKLILKFAKQNTASAGLEAALSTRIHQVEITEKYDAIVIDEAQDLFSEKYLPWLDAILENGLNLGSWFAFGDFQSQNLYNAKKEHELINEYSSNFFRYSLRHNCRNLPNIGHLTHSLVPSAPKWDSFRRQDDGIDPVIRFTGARANLTRELDDAVRYLKNQRFALNDIVVLTPSKIESPKDTFCESEFSEKFSPWSSSISGKIRFSTIHAFKGLESPCVILMELYDLIGNSDATHLKYTALTRATDRLFIIADIDSQKILESY